MEMGTKKDFKTSQRVVIRSLYSNIAGIDKSPFEVYTTTIIPVAGKWYLKTRPLRQVETAIIQNFNFAFSYIP